MVNGNIFDAIRRNQELERQKRTAKKTSFIDPSIVQVQGKRGISVIQAIQLSRPTTVRSQIAKPVSIRNQIGRTNISPQQKNIDDLKRAFPASVISPIDRSTFRELELTTEASGTQRIRGSEALENRLRDNIQGSSATVRRTGVFDSILSFINGLGFR